MSLPFVGVSVVVFLAGAAHAHREGTGRHYVSTWAAATVALLVLTAVFDNVMMAAGLFDFGSEEISGIRLGRMPLEDFLYPLAGALLLAGCWQMLSGSRGSKEHADD